MLFTRQSTLTPGLCILHGNHLEDLTDALVHWVRGNPLAPLEDEIFLVQSNGMAQWLKLALARDDACGISAAQQFQMPARFLWQAYRAVLGEDAVPQTSPFDKSRLRWRLMARLPELLDQPGFEPLQRFLGNDRDARKRYQLAERLADLYDQYQVYRADWLEAWEDERDQLLPAPGSGRQPEPLDKNRWQAILWRDLVQAMPETDRRTSRSHIHQQFLDTLEQGITPEGLPARIIVFGLSSLPLQALQALHALSAHCQILMLVQNPCQYYWADIIEDKELLRREQKRHGGKDTLRNVPEEEQHRHANPLLAAWGKQGRDYVGLLYDYDAPEDYRERFSEIDLFEPPATHHYRPDSLLAATQHAIWELDRLPDQPETVKPDDSIVFHRAHNPQREVEILHDQLLQAFQESAGEKPLRPRDIIVMVPDIETYAPHIEAVFGNLEESDERHIPYTISDRSQRHSRPMARALEQLLDLPRLRFTPGELLDLLETPALRNAFAIDEAQIPELRQWIHGAGIRWGLHGEQRSALDLPDGLEQNSWWFGLKRMLLGYAVGSHEQWNGIEPYDEVGGLQAALAGKLVALIETLEHHWRTLSEPARPAEWVEKLRSLMDELFLVEDQEDLQLQAGLLEALETWQDACDEADFDEALPLAVAKEEWLGALEQTSLSQRFLAGRVNFCTLMPMRSIPFRRVCLLGMNDGDYPRSQMPQDFDLMARPGHYRPGDRSRRDDDRYLFLEALLAAREQLYISWVGRDIRDNEERPPSVLVAQLRDYVRNRWGEHMARELTREHPLQPFSPRYFRRVKQDDDPDARLFTYGAEWREAHQGVGTAAENAPLVLAESDGTESLSPGALAGFLRNPPEHFYRRRLKVHFDEDEGEEDDSEPFSLDGLDRYRIGEQLITAMTRVSQDEQQDAFMKARAAVARAGELPAPPFDLQWLEQVAEPAWHAAEAWHDWCGQFPEALPLRELHHELSVRDRTMELEHWLADLRADGNGNLLQLQLVAGEIKGKPHKSLNLWTRHLLACASGLSLQSCLVAGDGCHRLRSVEAAQARQYLHDLADAWLEGLCHPLPLPCRTGLAFLEQRKKKDTDGALHKVRGQYEGGFKQTGEINHGGNTALKRSWPDFDRLLAVTRDDQPALIHWAETLYQPLLDHLEEEDHA